MSVDFLYGKAPDNSKHLLYNLDGQGNAHLMYGAPYVQVVPCRLIEWPGPKISTPSRTTLINLQFYPYTNWGPVWYAYFTFPGDYSQGVIRIWVTSANVFQIWFNHIITLFTLSYQAIYTPLYVSHAYTCPIADGYQSVQGSAAFDFLQGGSSEWATFGQGNPAWHIDFGPNVT